MFSKSSNISKRSTTYTIGRTLSRVRALIRESIHAYYLQPLTYLPSHKIPAYSEFLYDVTDLVFDNIGSQSELSLSFLPITKEMQPEISCIVTQEFRTRKHDTDTKLRFLN
jgi:hypothetical protein